MIDSTLTHEQNVDFLYYNSTQSNPNGNRLESGDEDAHNDVVM